MRCDFNQEGYIKYQTKVSEKIFNRQKIGHETQNLHTGAGCVPNANYI